MAKTFGMPGEELDAARVLVKRLEWRRTVSQCLRQPRVVDWEDAWWDRSMMVCLVCWFL